ncbi:hypothetical protein [Larkinella terrae]|uniref:Uncharacterized protein n=1 Tax=Larkinella terrae TaxID=2025311 RepID=A0A7K0EK11_9BACT|nr:hypothetical protein [Larkinella terrae]MRS61806.1 hypothetical protein [Larkinella terrae]
MGLIAPKYIEPGWLSLYPYLADDMTLPQFIKYGVYMGNLTNNNARYFQKGVTHLPESSFGVANSTNRALIHKIPGTGVLKNNGANIGGASNMTRSQVRTAATQANITWMLNHQMQEGEYYIAAGSNQAYWLMEKWLEDLEGFFPGQNYISAGNYGDSSMGQPDGMNKDNAVSFNGTLANATAAKAGLPFFQSAFSAIGGGTKTLADVHTGYNCRFYPTLHIGNEYWIHRMLYMMQRYVTAGWGTKWHQLFIWPMFESTGSDVAHSGWPYQFNTTNPAGVLDKFGHTVMAINQCIAAGFLWCQAMAGVTNRCVLVWNNTNGYSADINKQGATYPGSKPADRWNPAPGSPSTFPYVGDGQLSYPGEPLYPFDAIHEGINMWYRSYLDLGGEGTKAWAAYSLDNGSTWVDVDPGGTKSVIYGMANRGPVVSTEDYGSKRKWVFHHPYATPGVKINFLIKHVATNAVHSGSIIGDKVYCNVQNA